MWPTTAAVCLLLELCPTCVAYYSNCLFVVRVVSDLCGVLQQLFVCCWSCVRPVWRTTAAVCLLLELCLTCVAYYSNCLFVVRVVSDLCGVLQQLFVCC